MNYEELKSKWWFRLFKVVYVIAYFFAFLFDIFVGYNYSPFCHYGTYANPIPCGTWKSAIVSFVIAVLITIILFEIIKGIFFYVVIAEWKAFPSKKKSI